MIQQIAKNFSAYKFINRSEAAGGQCFCNSIQYRADFIKMFRFFIRGWHKHFIPNFSERTKFRNK